MTLDSILSHLSERAKALRHDRDARLQQVPRALPGRWEREVAPDMAHAMHLALESAARLREVEALIEILTRRAADEAIGR